MNTVGWIAVGVIAAFAIMAVLGAVIYSQASKEDYDDDFV